MGERFSKGLAAAREARNANALEKLRERSKKISAGRVGKRVGERLAKQKRIVEERIAKGKELKLAPGGRIAFKGKEYNFERHMPKSGLIRCWHIMPNNSKYFRELDPRLVTVVSRAP